MAESTGGRASSVRRGRRRGRTLEHVQLTGLAGLRELLARIQHNQALEHGVPQDSTLGDSYRLVLAERYTSAPGTIARTLQCLEYPPEVRLIMLDYDPEPTSTQQLTNAQELIDRLAAILPTFGEVGWLSTVSTSSAIRSKQARGSSYGPRREYMCMSTPAATWPAGVS